MKGLSKGRYDETFAGEDAGVHGWEFANRFFQLVFVSGRLETSDMATETNKYAAQFLANNLNKQLPPNS